MAVNTRRVTDRREVRYESFHELLADAESLSQSEVLMLGNWSLGQVFLHLARSMHASVDGVAQETSWWSCVAVKFRYGRRLLTGPMPAGMRLPAGAAQRLLPEPVSSDEGLAALREAVDRLAFETERAAHPLLGEMSLDHWDRFHLRHAELHMSFALPINVPVLV
ncbi:MAG TPA: DUF1569 domain-containing protein [Pirellulales bacterium]|jgi:hypothetical protein|nr:DUF1569 domain-containing protein [Pirellulales bacterium]